MRVLHVISDYQAAGAQRVALSLARAQGADIVAIRTGGPLADAPVLGKAHRWDVRALPRLVRHARDVRADLLHLHLFTGLFWGSLAARRLGLPTVATHHVDHPERRRHLRPLETRLLRRTRVVACSRAAQRHLASRGITADCIPNGVALTNEPLATLDGRPLHVVAIGRLVPVKDHHTLIEAMARLDTPAALTILGEGPLRDALSAHARKVGLHLQLPGVRDDIANQLRNADLFVSSSRAEALPMALLEACEAGVPAIVTDVGDQRDLVQGSGEVVPAGNVAMLAAALQRWAATPLRDRQERGRRARDIAERHSLQRMVADYARIYAEVA